MVMEKGQILQYYPGLLEREVQYDMDPDLNLL
jgi:hypothetical protein